MAGGACLHRLCPGPSALGLGTSGKTGVVLQSTGYRRLPDIPRNRTRCPVFSVFGGIFPGFRGISSPFGPGTTEPPIPAFSGEEEIELYYASTKDPDIPVLLARPLEWDLFTQEPSVLILHTHSSESYTKTGEPYTESSGWRTLDEGYNMISIGELVAGLLQEQGIPVLQSRELNDYPSYNGSYTRARKTIKDYLAKYPSIQLVLDLHRDASGDENGQMRTRATVNGEDSAQLMVVIGTNHEDYEENLCLGLKLHAQLEAMHPGIMRPLQLRSQRFNQDLSPGALLIEVGAAGNTRPEALTAAKELAKAIVALAKGTG